MRYTNEKFKKSLCYKCIWLKKVNKEKAYCIFPSCIRSVEEVNETSKNSESKKGEKD